MFTYHTVYLDIFMHAGEHAFRVEGNHICFSLFSCVKYVSFSAIYKSDHFLLAHL